jgi:hypothetical protein
MAVAAIVGSAIAIKEESKKHVNTRSIKTNGRTRAWRPESTG